MKIFYNRKEIQNDIEDINSQNKLSASCRLVGDPVEAIKKYKGPPIGFAPPDGWINFGQHVINFVISEEMATGIISAGIWEAIKQGFLRLKKRQKDSNDMLAVITDEYKPSETEKSVYFVLYAYQKPEEAEEAIKQIPEVRRRLFNLLEIADIGGRGDTLRLTFIVNKWSIN